MLEKIEFKIRNKLFYLNNEDLIEKCLDRNYLISKNAILELLRRNPVNIKVNDEILNLVINKLTIEEIWYLVACKVNSRLVHLACLKLNSILDYYENLNKKDNNLKLYENKRIIKIK